MPNQFNPSPAGTIDSRLICPLYFCFVISLCLSAKDTAINKSISLNLIPMIIINFAHPLTPLQKQQLEDLSQRPIAAVIDVPFQMDNAQPFVAQVTGRIDTVGFSPQQWQTEPILINPPAYAPAGAILLAELHGRMGYFPMVIRIRPVPNATPPTFEVAELLNLQAVRDQARAQR